MDARYRANNPEKLKNAKAAYVKASPEKAKASSAKYRAANKEKSNARHAAWAKDNREKINANRAAWHRAHPEAARITWHNRQARKRNSGGSLSQGLSKRLFKLQKGRCACCKKPLGQDYHLDHIMPLALGGANVDGNMQLLRALCNMQKSAKHPLAFMQERGFLL